MTNYEEVHICKNCKDRNTNGTNSQAVVVAVAMDVAYQGLHCQVLLAPVRKG